MYYMCEETISEKLDLGICYLSFLNEFKYNLNDNTLTVFLIINEMVLRAGF